MGFILPYSDTHKSCHYGLTLSSGTAWTRQLTAHGHRLLGLQWRWSPGMFCLGLEDVLQAFDLSLQHGHSNEDSLLQSGESLLHLARCLFSGRIFLLLG